jgi:hypothetical protein
MAFRPWRWQISRATSRVTRSSGERLQLFVFLLRFHQHRQICIIIFPE